MNMEQMNEIPIVSALAWRYKPDKKYVRVMVCKEYNFSILDLDEVESLVFLAIDESTSIIQIANKVKLKQDIFLSVLVKFLQNEVIRYKSSAYNIWLREKQ